MLESLADNSAFLDVPLNLYIYKRLAAARRSTMFDCASLHEVHQGRCFKEMDTDGA